MFEKQCTKCFNTKHISNFGKSKLGLYGVRSVCKTCKKKQDYEYELTKEGLVTRMLIRQKSRSKRKGFNKPSYTKQELINWLFNQELFHELYDNWTYGGYQHMDTPSLDRIDNTKGYSIDNVTLMTTHDNLRNSHEDRKNGVNVCGDVCKAVRKLSKKGEILSDFISANEAGRITGLSVQSIASACRTKKIYKDYYWTYLYA